MWFRSEGNLAGTWLVVKRRDALDFQVCSFVSCRFSMYSYDASPRARLVVFHVKKLMVCDGFCGVVIAVLPDI